MMSKYFRQPLLTLALCASFAVGCTIPDRNPVGVGDDPADAGLDAGLADRSGSDAPRDASVTDDRVTDDRVLPDAPVDGIRTDDIREGGPGLGDTPLDAVGDRTTSTCVSGAVCVPANACHQGETVCGDAGAVSCRDTMRSQTNGTTCDKGVCLDGNCQTCAAGAVCEVQNKPCRSGTTICATGSPVCTESANQPNGTACGTGMVCQEGICKACVAGEACTPTDPCHAGKLSCTGGTPTCTDSGTTVPAGTGCGQDKVCSSTGTCVACTAGATCTVAGNVCRTGTTACNTGAPVCIESANAPNGTSCGTDKVCSGGMCVTCTPGLSCVPANACHTGTTVCSPTVECVGTGTSVPNGTSCGTDKVCSTGVCSPCAAGQTCQTMNACKTGTLSCGTGVPKCDESGNQPNGTSCGTNQVCASGTCGMCTNGASCTPTNPCHTGTLSCSTGAPVCNDTNTNVSNGTTCGPDQVCRDGTCSACAAGGACQPTEVCKTGSFSCATGTQVCVASANKPQGTSCGAEQSCTGGQTTAAAVCNASGLCPTPAVTTCANGCNSAGTACLTCSAGQMACNGTCCASGQGCCGNVCAPLDTAAHCGSCTPCPTGQICNSSRMCETPTWCSTQMIPDGIAATDYQCLDFDSGAFPPAGWTQNIVAPGLLQKTGARFSSSPSALQSICPLEPGLQGRSRLDWTAPTSGSAVSSISVTSMVNTMQPQFEVGWTDSVDLLCLAFENEFSRACLRYTYGNAGVPWTADLYTGLYIHFEYNIGGIFFNDCPVAGAFASNVWSSIELRVPTSTGHVEAVVNGTPTTCSNPSQTGIPPTTVPLVFVGSYPNAARPATDNPSAWAAYFDNVKVVVRR